MRSNEAAKTKSRSKRVERGCLKSPKKQFSKTSKNKNNRVLRGLNNYLKKSSFINYIFVTCILFGNTAKTGAKNPFTQICTRLRSCVVPAVHVVVYHRYCRKRVCGVRERERAEREPGRGGGRERDRQKESEGVL